VIRQFRFSQKRSNRSGDPQNRWGKIRRGLFLQRYRKGGIVGNDLMAQTRSTEQQLEEIKRGFGLGTVLSVEGMVCCGPLRTFLAAKNVSQGEGRSVAVG